MSLDLWMGIAIGSFIPWVILLIRTIRRRKSKALTAEALKRVAAAADASSKEMNAAVRKWAAGKRAEEEARNIGLARIAAATKSKTKGDTTK